MRGIMGSNVGGGGTSMDDIERMVRRLQEEDEYRDEI